MFEKILEDKQYENAVNALELTAEVKQNLINSLNTINDFELPGYDLPNVLSAILADAQVIINYQNIKELSEEDFQKYETTYKDLQTKIQQFDSDHRQMINALTADARQIYVPAYAIIVNEIINKLSKKLQNKVTKKQTEIMNVDNTKIEEMYDKLFTESKEQFEFLEVSSKDVELLKQNALKLHGYFYNNVDIEDKYNVINKLINVSLGNNLPADGKLLDEEYVNNVLSNYNNDYTAAKSDFQTRYNDIIYTFAPELRPEIIDAYNQVNQSAEKLHDAMEKKMNQLLDKLKNDNASKTTEIAFPLEPEREVIPVDEPTLTGEETELERLKKENEKLKAENAKLKQEIEQRDKAIADLNTKIDNLAKDVDSMKRRKVTGVSKWKKIKEWCGNNKGKTALIIGGVALAGLVASTMIYGAPLAFAGRVVSAMWNPLHHIGLGNSLHGINKFLFGTLQGATFNPATGIWSVGTTALNSLSSFETILGSIVGIGIPVALAGYGVKKVYNHFKDKSNDQDVDDKKITWFTNAKAEAINKVSKLMNKAKDRMKNYRKAKDDVIDEEIVDENKVEEILATVDELSLDDLGRLSTKYFKNEDPLVNEATSNEIFKRLHAIIQQRRAQENAQELSEEDIANGFGEWLDNPIEQNQGFNPPYGPEAQVNTEDRDSTNISKEQLWEYFKAKAKENGQSIEGITPEQVWQEYEQQLNYNTAEGRTR